MPATVLDSIWPERRLLARVDEFCVTPMGDQDLGLTTPWVVVPLPTTLGDVMMRFGLAFEKKSEAWLVGAMARAVRRVLLVLALQVVAPFFL